MSELWSAIRMLIAEMLLHVAVLVAPANRLGQPLLKAVASYFTERER